MNGIYILSFLLGWFYPRSERITAKGKGELQTFWLDLSAASIDDRMSLSTSSINTSLSWQNRNTENDRRLKRNIGGKSIALADLQTCRLVDWILDTLNPMLCRIVSQESCAVINPKNKCEIPFVCHTKSLLIDNNSSLLFSRYLVERLLKVRMTNRNHLMAKMDSKCHMVQILLMIC
jgi:hypothetical protein